MISYICHSILTPCTSCIGPKADLTQLPRRPTSAFVLKHDKTAAAVSGAMAAEPMSYLGLETWREPVAKGVYRSNTPVESFLVPRIRKKIVKHLHKIRENIAEKNRYSQDKEVIMSKHHAIKSRLMDTFESSISIMRVKQCKDMIEKIYHESAQEEVEVYMDSDDEMALYDEIDAITEAVEHAEGANMSWELVAAKRFNQAALKVSILEDSYYTLHELLCSVTGHRRGKSLCSTRQNSEVVLKIEDVAQAVAQLGANISSLDLDKVLEEVQTSMPYLKSIAPHRDFHVHADQVEVWSFIASSASFRKSIIEMEINEPLCDFLGSMFKQVFTESEARVLIQGCRQREIVKGSVLYDDSSVQRSSYWTLIISGDVSVSQVLLCFTYMIVSTAELKLTFEYTPLQNQ